MNETCPELAPLLAADRLGVLEGDARTRLQDHLASGCVDCRDLARDLGHALARAECPPVAPPPRARARLLERIAADHAEAARRSGPALVVRLSCTYCHDSLVRTEAVFCAGCLAPCHEDCFESHGRCAAPGCSETRVLRPSALGRKRRRWGGCVAAVVVCGAGAAFATLSLNQVPRPIATPPGSHDNVVLDVEVPARYSPSAATPYPVWPVGPVPAPTLAPTFPVSPSPARRPAADDEDDAPPRPSPGPQPPRPRAGLDPVGGGPETRSPEAESSCNCSDVLSDFVDFSKRPDELEGPNKLRVSLMPGVDPMTNRPVIDVGGLAYYPDGVVLIVGIRHAKVRTYFDQKKVVVKDHVFSYRFGPFQKLVPGGGLVIEAEFILAQQTQAVQRDLVAGNYFKHAPPCKHDKGNRNAVRYSRGAETETEDASVKAEKEAIAAFRKGALAAHAACGVAIATGDATEALRRLNADLEDIGTTFDRWRAQRQFVLFVNRIAELKLLRSHVRDANRARAAAAGFAVPNLSGVGASAVQKSEEAEVTKLADELAGFLAESDSLDKAFEASGQKH